MTKYRNRVSISAPDSIKMLFLLQKLLTYFQVKAFRKSERLSLNGISAVQIIRDSQEFFDYSYLEDGMDCQRQFVIEVIHHDRLLRDLYCDGSADWFFEESRKSLKGLYDYLHGSETIPDVTLVKNLSRTVCDNSFYLNKKHHS